MSIVPGNAQGQEELSVVIPGTSILNGPARKAFELAMLKYGNDLVEEAKRVEMGPRLRTGGASADAQFTDWMIMQAEDHVRPVRYVVQAVKRWPSVLRVFGGLLFASAGAAFGFATSQPPKYMSADAWLVAGIAMVVIGVVLELTSIFAPRGAQ